MSAPPISVQFDDKRVLDALGELLRRVARPRPALREIGESLTESTKRRFETSTAPDGSHWAGNSDVTLMEHLGRTKGNFRNDGGLTKRGAARLGAKKPLIGETRSLSTKIHYNVLADGVEIGSSMEYAGMMHFGGKKSEYSKLWGDIPPRKFIGVSNSDASNTLDILGDYIGGSMR
jgi:phage gpG-like protein